jgi:two-component system KDP operon response regulator KdpE
MHVADRRFVRPDGAEVTMSPTEWRLIEVLVQHAGHLVTREELLVSVWGPQAASKTQYLRVHMSSIRQKVEPDPARPRYFVTVPGLGVRFDAEGGTPSGAAQSLTPTG